MNRSGVHSGTSKITIVWEFGKNEIVELKLYCLQAGLPDFARDGGPQRHFITLFTSRKAGQVISGFFSVYGP